MGIMSDARNIKSDGVEVTKGKLKTLDDIRFVVDITECDCDFHKDDCCPVVHMVCKDRLKQEAIKLVNELINQKINSEYCLVCNKEHTDDCENKNHKYLVSYEYDVDDIGGAIKVLKHFLNITNEDLKTPKSCIFMENTETTTEAPAEAVEKTETSETVAETPVEKTDETEEAKTEESDEADTEETKE